MKQDQYLYGYDNQNFNNILHTNLSHSPHPHAHPNHIPYYPSYDNIYSNRPPSYVPLNYFGYGYPYPPPPNYYPPVYGNPTNMFQMYPPQNIANPNIPNSNVHYTPNMNQQYNNYGVVPNNNYNRDSNNDVHVSHPEVMHMKVAISNLESENLALKDRMREINIVNQNQPKSENKFSYTTTPQRDSLPSPKQNYEKIVKDYKTKLEVKNKENVELKMKLDSVSNDKEIFAKNYQEVKTQSDKLEKNTKELELAYKELNRREDIMKRLTEENEKLKNYLENVKRENISLK
jgi:hypothetical protein